MVHPARRALSTDHRTLQATVATMAEVVPMARRSKTRAARTTSLQRLLPMKAMGCLLTTTRAFLRLPAEARLKRLIWKLRLATMSTAVPLTCQSMATMWSLLLLGMLLQPKLLLRLGSG